MTLLGNICQRGKREEGRWAVLSELRGKLRDMPEIDNVERPVSVPLVFLFLVYQFNSEWADEGWLNS